ncbi:hypothetical protein V8G54_008532 [Vigna mungo]|uniref:Uncharacterized protein n=1 Tax=Vigna mungo TaxID=3915 RepID=A0AAQ3P401_VIGMU
MNMVICHSFAVLVHCCAWKETCFEGNPNTGMKVKKTRSVSVDSDPFGVDGLRPVRWSLSTNHELRDVVLLVFSNKQDLPNAMNAAKTTEDLGLHSIRQCHWWASIVLTTLLIRSAIVPLLINQLKATSKLMIMMTVVDDLVSVDTLIEERLTVEPCNEYN